MLRLARSTAISGLQGDYGKLPPAFVELFDVTGDAAWLPRAQTLAHAMIERFWDPDRGGFFMNAAGSDPLLIARPKESTDRTLPSGNSVAIRLLAALAARTGEPRYRKLAEEMAATFSGAVARAPYEHVYFLLGIADLARGAAGPREYAAQGTVAVRARITGSNGKSRRLTLDFRIRDGWHINAHHPLEENLIATSVTVGTGRGAWRLTNARFPPPTLRRLSFQSAPLALYQGNARVEVDIAGNAGSEAADAPVVPIHVKLQACSDKVCLLPEVLALEVPAAGL